MKNLISILFVFLVFLSCNSKGDDNKSNGTTIRGKIENLGNSKIYLEELGTKEVRIADSVTTDNDGNFQFKLNLENPAFYRVRLNDSRFITLVIKPKEQIILNSSASSFDQNYSVEGSEGSEKLKVLNSFIQKSFAEANHLDELYRQKFNQHGINNDSLTQTLRNQYENVIAERERFVKKFIYENEGSLTLLAAVSYLTPEKDFAYYEKAGNSLAKKHPESEYVIDLNNRIKDLKKLSAGSEAPEIILPDTSGKNVSLSSLRGKYVLIDFWAAWCGPCRMENPNLVKVYNKFKDKGFEILGVSLDNNKQAWQGAIASDKLTWIHVSDLMRWNSPVVKLYRVEGIPFSVLLDRDGKIIEKGLRSEALDKRLTELLQ